MALPKTDAFTGTDWTDISTYNASWVENRGTFAIYSNSLCGSTGDDDIFAHWEGDTFANDQYATTTIVVASSATTIWIGVAVRCASGSTDTCYRYIGAGTTQEVDKFVGGTFTLLEQGFTGWDATDVIRLEVSGTTLTPKVNGALDEVGTQTDSSISSGYAGVCGYSGDAASARIDDWEGGNISTANQINKSEGTTLGESVTIGAITRSLSVTDGATIGETVSISAGSPATLPISSTDGATVGESVAISGLATRSLSITDSTTVGETVGVSLPGLPARTVSVSDDVGVNDPPFTGEVAVGLSVTDAVTLGESIAVGLANALGAAVTDNIPVGESAGVSLAGAAAQTINVTDGATVGEVANLIELLPGITVTDGTTIGEAITTAEGAIVINVDDPAAIGEAVLAALSTLAAQAIDDTTTADVPTVVVQEPPLPALSINVTPDNHAYWVQGVKVQ